MDQIIGPFRRPKMQQSGELSEIASDKSCSEVALLGLNLIPMGRLIQLMGIGILVDLE